MSVISADTLANHVAFITGVARGQGRAHAVKLASMGADIVGIDICRDIASMDYPNATEDDLLETVRLVEKQGRSMIGSVADVRDPAGLATAVNGAMDRFGRIDIVIANAGIVRYTPTDDRAAIWRDTLDVNLTGVWNTIEATIAAVRGGKRGGSVVITSSTAGLKGSGTDKASAQAYTASKRGLVGLMQTLANEYAPESIRVNTIHPTGVISGMTDNAVLREMHEASARGERTTISSMQNALPVAILPAEDIANAVAWLVSPDARYVTGIALPIDAGFSVR